MALKCNINHENHAMRWVVGLLLVFAALLKAVQLLTEPATALVHGPWFAPLAIGVELALGLLALTGIYWQQLRWLTLLLFTMFAAYSFHLALAGAATCGCFGPLEVHPWWTFTLDVAVVFGLVFSLRGHPMSTEDATLEIPINAHPWRGEKVLTAVVAAVFVLSIAVLVRLASERTVSAEGVLTTAGDLVVLEPEKWFNKPLPILDYIDLSPGSDPLDAADLMQGIWTVLLHRHDCPACQEAVPRYEQLATAGGKVALIEVPPYGPPEPAGSACLKGHLKQELDWFVQTPVEIQLQNGIVTAVKIPDH